MLSYIEKIFFYLLIFCIPFQTRKILFWNSNEFQSVSFYFTDLLIFSLFFFWFFRAFKTKKNYFNRLNAIWARKHIIDLSLVLFSIISLVSLIRADNIFLGIYKWIKLLEFIGLFWYVKNRYKEDGVFLREVKIPIIPLIFIFNAVFQSFISIFQYAYQRSAGLKILGESFLGIDIYGVAKITTENLKFIRAYGTFPHPNILATFILICLVFLFFLYIKIPNWNKKFTPHYFCNKNGAGVTKRKIKKDIIPLNGIILAGIYPLLIFSLYLTFSRVVFLLWILTSILFFIWFWRYDLYKRKVKKLALFFIIYNLLFIILLFPELSFRFRVSPQEQAVSLRIFYIQIASVMISSFPILGIGLSQFPVKLSSFADIRNSWMIQPVHNIYLLMASEVGLLGLGFFLFFVICLMRNSLFKLKTNSQSVFNFSYIICVLCLLIIGLFDHFLITIQSGQLIFWVILGLSARNE